MTLPAATHADSTGTAPAGASVARAAPRAMAYPLAPLLAAAGVASISLVPRVHQNPTLVWTLSGVAAALGLWTLLLGPLARRRGQVLRTVYYPVRAHWVQATVQAIIMAYWAWATEPVVLQAPLLVAQIFFFYALDALLSWTRGREWRLGFGPLPIVLSTNLLLWFRDDWYYLQFVMLTLGVLGKNFVTWKRDGQRTHIVNPSAFGQIILALALIATGTTDQLTFGRQIATSFEVPHMVIVIFLCGLVVQALFEVTLMTLAAVATIVALNVAYTETTGLYFFVNTNFAAPIFLGVHLFITDPATSPRSNVGRVLFGCLYGLAYFALFRVLLAFEVPLFWDKLLPVPILNLMVPLIDRVARGGWLGPLNRRWESALPHRQLNLVHMGLWTALFGTMYATGFIDHSPHPGDSIPFWKRAWAEGRPSAGPSLVLAAGAQAEIQGSGAAFNELGLVCMEATIPGVRQSDSKAAEYFAQACDLGNLEGCENVAIQYLFKRELRSQEGLLLALARLEKACQDGPDTLPCYLLAAAYESGHGRPINFSRAIELYRRCGPANLYACKGLARIALLGIPHPLNPVPDIIPTLEQAFEAGDAESGWYLAYLHHKGLGVEHDDELARSLLDRCCSLGMQAACEALAQPTLPAYSKPVMSVPGWATAFPLETPPDAGS